MWAGRTCTDVRDLFWSRSCCSAPNATAIAADAVRVFCNATTPLTCADVRDLFFEHECCSVPLDTPIPAVDVRAFCGVPSPPPPSWPSPADPPPPPSLPPPSPPSPAPPSPPDAPPNAPPLLSLRYFNLYWDHHNTENMKVYMPCMIANVNEVANYYASHLSNWAGIPRHWHQYDGTCMRITQEAYWYRASYYEGECTVTKMCAPNIHLATCEPRFACPDQCLEIAYGVESGAYSYEVHQNDGGIEIVVCDATGRPPSSPPATPTDHPRLPPTPPTPPRPPRRPSPRRPP